MKIVDTTTGSSANNFIRLQLLISVIVVTVTWVVYVAGSSDTPSTLTTNAIVVTAGDRHDIKSNNLIVVGDVENDINIIDGQNGQRQQPFREQQQESCRSSQQ